MSQNKTLLRHLESGKTITRLEALFVYGIQSITARVSDLRAQGHDVRATIKTDPKGHEYAEYHLVREEAA